MDPAACGLGIQGILCPNLSDQTGELVYHMTMGTNSWGITLPILSRPRTQGGLPLPEPELFLMHHPFVSLLVSQVSRKGSGDLLYMGDNHRVHTIQRQPPIHPAGHGPDGGADVLGMVVKGTLTYPTGGPTGSTPGKPGPTATVALCLLPQ